MLNVELPYDLTILLPVLYPKLLKAGTRIYICAPMFIAALSTIAKTWKQPKCPTDEQIKNMWCTHTMKYHSALKEEGNPAMILMNVQTKDIYCGAG